MKFLIFPVLALLLISFAGCGSSREVSRVSPDTVTDITGRWNDTDSRLTAEEMITDVLKKNWLTDFMTAKSKKPTVIVGTIRNKSSEHIATDVFIKDIERELVNSGKVTIVADKTVRDDVRDERQDQRENASLETMKQFYKELGADFFLVGVVNSIEDSFDGEKVLFYQVDLELINIETNEKVWLGNKKIKKVIEQKKSGW